MSGEHWPSGWAVLTVTCVMKRKKQKNLTFILFLIIAALELFWVVLFTFY